MGNWKFVALPADPFKAYGLTTELQEGLAAAHMLTRAPADVAMYQQGARLLFSPKAAEIFAGALSLHGAIDCPPPSTTSGVLFEGNVTVAR